MSQKNRNLRTFDVVSIFIDPLLGAIDDDERVDVWFIIVPDRVYTYCRPQSGAPNGVDLAAPLLSRNEARKFKPTNWLFPDMQQEDAAKEAEKIKYDYDAQFHDQFKIRMLSSPKPTQIIRESTLDWRSYVRNDGKVIRDLSKIEGHIAWTLSTAAYYKAGGKPWQLSDVRPGVCYLGLIYKQCEHSADVRNACCAAQMFLNSGDQLLTDCTLSESFSKKWNEDILYGDALYNFTSGKWKYKTPATITANYLINNGTILHSGGSFIKRQLFIDYGVYDENLRIVADWKFFIQAIVCGTATTKHLNITLSLYDVTGISTTNQKLVQQEHDLVLAQMFSPPIISSFQQLSYLEKENKQMLKEQLSIQALSKAPFRKLLRALLLKIKYKIFLKSEI